MEHVEHTLSRELLLNPRGLPLPKAKLVAFQLASALEFVHGKKVFHGDLKPANVLLTSQYSVKLCDFGSATSAVLRSTPAEGGNAGGGRNASPFAATLLEPAAAPKVTAAASRWYCAPESLLGSEGSPASDIWAYGCILAELITSKPLMPGGENELDQLCWVLSMIGRLSRAQEQLLQLLPWEQRSKLDEARARGPLLDRIPKIAACPALAEVLRACLQPDPACRPTAKQLQAMPLFDDLREALAASEVAAAAAEAAEAAVATAAEAVLANDNGGGLPSRPRRTSSGNMDVDVVAAASTDGTRPCGAAAAAEAQSPACGAQSPPVAPAGAVACADAGVAQLPRRVSGVQAAVPVRPVSRARVSALTATIRGNPFEGDGGYTDLMPQVLRLAAMWVEAGEWEALGPIAMAARRSCSLSPAASLPPAPSGDFLGARLPSGAIAAALAAAATAAKPGALPAVAVACTTPIAAAAGGCGAVLSTACKAPLAVTAATVVAASSPMDASPATPATAAGAAAGALASASKANIPLSASVGAVPYMAKAAGVVASCAGAGAAAAAAPVIQPSSTQLRSRAIIYRARRYYSREPRAVSVPSAFLDSSSPRGGGLGYSATLMQRELAAAVVQPPPPGGHHTHGAVRGLLLHRATGCHAARRSFADLSDLASVAEYEALPCDTPPDVKRRRGLAHHALLPTHSSQPSAGSFNSFVTEASLESLPEQHEPVLFSRGSALPLPGGGGRRLRRSSSGTGLAGGSPVLRRGAWQQLLLPGGAAREVSLPQPISGRNRRSGGFPARGLPTSASSDVQSNPAAADAYLCGEAA